MDILFSRTRVNYLLLTYIAHRNKPHRKNSGWLARLLAHTLFLLSCTSSCVDVPGFYSRCISMLSSSCRLLTPPLFFYFRHIPALLRQPCKLGSDSCKLCCDTATCDISLVSHLACNVHAVLFSVQNYPVARCV